MSDWMDAEQHADRALQMYERGRWAEAEAELRKAIALNPDQPEWHFNLGLTLEQSGRDPEALTSYERAIDLMPDQPEPRVAAGVVANRLQQFDKAVKWFEAALAMDQTIEEAYAHKIESHTRLGNHDEAETTFYLAQQALSAPSAQCLAVMAESLMQRDLFDRAEWCLKEALRLEPTMPRLRARLAAVCAATGKPQRALQLYMRELRDDPGSIDTLLECGELLMGMDRLPEAAEKFRRVLELEPSNVPAHFALGGVALRTHRYEQAHLEFELVLKLDPQFPAIRQAMGEALLKRGRIDEARRVLVEELEILKSADAPPAPPTPPSAASAEPSGAGDAAWPSDPLTLAAAQRDMLDLANLLLEAHAPQSAAELLEEAVKVQETPDLLRQLALARFRCGDRARGVVVSRRVLRLDPTCIRSIHNLALAALEERRIRTAAGWIRRGLLLNRHDDGLRRLRIRTWMAQCTHWWKQLPHVFRVMRRRVARITVKLLSVRNGRAQR